MPTRPELPPAPDVGDDIDPALLEPELSGGGGIGRGLADQEAAVGVEQGRVGAVHRRVLPANHRVGNPCAVLRHRPVLLGDQVRSVEPGRQAAQACGRPCPGVCQPLTGGGQIARRAHQDPVAVLRRRGQGQGRVRRQGQGLGGPGPARPLQAADLAADSVQQADDQTVAGRGDLLHALALRRAQDEVRLQGPGRRADRSQVEVHQVAGLHAGLRPVGLEGDHKPARDEGLHGRAERQGQFHGPVSHQQVMLGAEGVEGPGQDHRLDPPPGIAEDLPVHPVAAVSAIPAEHFLGLGKGLTALQDARHIRIAGEGAFCG